MANRMSVRRVMFQNLNEDGTPDGPPAYGVIASDDYGKTFNNLYDSYEELEEAIQEQGILSLVQGEDGPFEDLDPDLIGTDNFYGCYHHLEEGE